MGLRRVFIGLLLLWCLALPYAVQAANGGGFAPITQRAADFRDFITTLSSILAPVAIAGLFASLIRGWYVLGTVAAGVLALIGIANSQYFASWAGFGG